MIGMDGNRVCGVKSFDCFLKKVPEEGSERDIREAQAELERMIGVVVSS